jgi:nicotinamidase-related amidase
MLSLFFLFCTTLSFANHEGHIKELNLWGKDILLVGYMQAEFAPALKQDLQAAIGEEIQEAMKKEMLIIYLEIVDKGPTVENLLKLTKDYAYKVRLTHDDSTFSGYETVKSFLDSVKLKYIREIRLCGVYTEDRIEYTGRDLFQRIEMELELLTIVEKACASDSQKTHDATIDFFKYAGSKAGYENVRVDSGNSNENYRGDYRIIPPHDKEHKKFYAYVQEGKTKELEESSGFKWGSGYTILSYGQECIINDYLHRRDIEGLKKFVKKLRGFYPTEKAIRYILRDFAYRGDMEGLKNYVAQNLEDIGLLDEDIKELRKLAKEIKSHYSQYKLFLNLYKVTHPWMGRCSLSFN